MPKTELTLNQKPNTEQTTFYKKIGVKRVLICFHGFQTSTIHDLTAFKKYFEEKNFDSDFEVVLVDLYDYGDKSTYKWKGMYQRAEKVVSDYLDKKYIVYLLAYSFSVGIAAKCCTDFPCIEKLTLVSPTIYLFKTKLFSSYAKMLIKRLKFKLKYKQKAQKLIKKEHSSGMLKLSFAIMLSIVKNRKYLKALRCKVFMTKGNKDDLCVPNTFSYISKKSKNSITMSKIYPNEDHVMIMSLQHGKRAFEDVLRFIFHIDEDDNDSSELRF